MKTVASKRPPLSGDAAFKLLGTDMNGVMTAMDELRARSIRTNIVDKAMASLGGIHKGIPSSIIDALYKQVEKKLEDLAEPSQAGPLPEFMKIVIELTGSPPTEVIKNGLLTRATSKEAGGFFKGFRLVKAKREALIRLSKLKLGDADRKALEAAADPEAYKEHSSLMASLVLAQGLYRDGKHKAYKEQVQAALESCVAYGMSIPEKLHALVSAVAKPPVSVDQVLAAD